MTGELETPVITDNKEKTDKELIAEEEKAAETTEEKTTEVEETPAEKEEKPTKPVKEKKPTVFKKDWEEGKVYLFQSNRTPRIPNIVPNELMLESFLKLHGIPYENINHNSRISLKKIKMPYIELDGEELTEVDLIMKMAEKFEKNMSENLSMEQMNIEHAMMKMVENHLYWAIMDWRTETMDNTIKAYNINLTNYLDSKLPPPLLTLHFKMNVIKKMQKKTKSQAHHDLETAAKNDMKVLSEMLGEKVFMFGEEPSMLDLIVFSVLAQLVMVEEVVKCPLKDHLTENYQNLVELVNKMKEKCWGEHWDLAVGDTLDLNPHIPKPEPEPAAEETKEEEKKDEEVDEKKEEKTEETKEEEKKDEEKEEDTKTE